MQFVVLEHSDIDIATCPEYSPEAIKFAVLAPALRDLIIGINDPGHSVEDFCAQLAVAEHSLPWGVHKMVTRFHVLKSVVLGHAASIHYFLGRQRWVAPPFFKSNVGHVLEHDWFLFE